MDGVEEPLTDFEGRIVELFVGSNDEETLLDEILAIILLLFILGADYDDESDITPQDREWLDTMYQMSVAAAPGIAARNDGTFDMAPTVQRIKFHVLGAYSYSFMAHGMDAEENYSWNLGATETHCGDCFGYAGLGPMPGSFWEQVATERNHYPQSPNLECKGLHCDCMVG